MYLIFAAVSQPWCNDVLAVYVKKIINKNVGINTRNSNIFVNVALKNKPANNIQRDPILFGKKSACNLTKLTHSSALIIVLSVFLLNWPHSHRVTMSAWISVRMYVFAIRCIFFSPLNGPEIT